jgi:hypothetical protein
MTKKNAFDQSGSSPPTRYRINFIFGSSKVSIVDQAMNRHLQMDITEPASEQNYRHHFQYLVEALRVSGNLLPGDRVNCFVFP